MISCMSLLACAAETPTNLGVKKMRLAPCPPLPKNGWNVFLVLSGLGPVRVTP